MKPADQITYLFSIQQHIHENIKFADQKAVAFLAINTALIAVLYGAKAPPDVVLAFNLYTALALFLLCVGVALSLCVVYPRQEHRTSGGFTDPSRIVQWLSEDTYKEKYASLGYDELREDLLMLVRDRSKINERKYTYLSFSFWASILGWTPTLLLLMKLKFP